MNIIWFSWKDELHPQAGGAELVSSELRKRLVRDGHNVRLITARYENSQAKENVEGVDIYRVGGRLSVYFKAFRLFRSQMKTWPDLVIDEANTIPFGCAFYTRKRSVLLTYQLARQVWFYQMPLPFSLIGYLLEPIYLFVLSRKYKQVVTESESTRTDLAKYGFSKDRTHVFRVGISLPPVAKLGDKSRPDTVLSLGALRPMKRTLDAVKAFEVAKDLNDKLSLVIAGDACGPYARKVIGYVNSSRHSGAIEILGRVSNEKRLQLMQEAGLIIVTSIKEGWGLIVTEANSQGTPAAAYDADGLRDSIKNGETGRLVPNSNFQSLGKAINEVLSHTEEYTELRENAWKFSHEFTFENSYADFASILKLS